MSKNEAARQSRLDTLDQPLAVDPSTAPGPSPYVGIFIAIEARPSVRIRCQNESEELRIRDWIERNPPLRQIVDAALRLRDAA